jgi:hypothetical protein
MATTLETSYRVAFIRRVSALLLLSTASLWLLLVDTKNGATFSSLRGLKMIPLRPKIYTFMDDTSQNNDRYRLWKATWRSAGFDARPLTVEDAAKHVKFEAFAKALGAIEPFRDDESSKRKILRYLAMAVVGGGFLADVDVLPLWPLNYMHDREGMTHLISDRHFTVRCGSTKNPAGCLMSGSPEEWERTASQVLESHDRQYKRVNDKDTQIRWGEESALQELASFANPNGRPIIKQEVQVLSSVQARELKSLPTFLNSQCHEAIDRVAVKFGYADDQAVDGLRYAQGWLKGWNQDCVNKLARDNLSIPTIE